jgi:succinoglycan biosynthesis protein ExoM
MKNLISICIATRKRKKLLLALLNSIAKIIVPSGYKIEIILVINEASLEPYKKILNKFYKKISLTILCEKKIGIVFARNRYLRHIKNKKSKYLAFFDDDCCVDQNWLISNLKILNSKLNCDIIAGPQISISRSNYSKLLERNEPNLKKINWASTNNCFLKKSIISKYKIYFSPKLHQIGGEDQLFFLQLKKRGASLIWNSNAKVYEYRNKSRENMRWFINRNLRYGTSSIIIFRELHGKINCYLFILMKICNDIFLSLKSLISLDKFPKNILSFMMYSLRVVGIIFGLFRKQIYEYK